MPCRAPGGAGRPAGGKNRPARWPGLEPGLARGPGGRGGRGCWRRASSIRATGAGWRGSCRDSAWFCCGAAPPLACRGLRGARSGFRAGFHDGFRFGLLVTPALPGAAIALAASAAASVTLFGRCVGVGHGAAGGRIRPGDALADQLFDLADRPAVGRCDDGDRGAALAGAAGPADAVDVVVRVVRHVEIEDVAHVGNVEATRGDVGGDQQRHAAVAERVERGRARGLIEVAVQRRGVEAVPDQRAVQLRDLALAVAEDDGVLEVLGRADQAAQRVALLVRTRGRP